MSCWYVYIVRCSDRSLYTGIARNVDVRIAEHNEGGRNAARYTRSRRPVSLVYRQQFDSRSEAARREAAIKRLSKADKERLVGTAGM
jgi:putative endonuclease